MSTDPLTNLLAKLDRVKAKPAGGYMAPCPGHDDQHASLSIDQADDGKVLLKCFAGCELERIVAAIGLTPADLFPPRDASPPPASGPERLECVYAYQDEHAATLYEVLRFTPKTFKQRVPLPGGGYRYSMNGTRRVLYRLPDIMRAKPGDLIVVVEGEKDADRLRREGFVATTHAGGTGNTKQSLPLYVETLAGRHVAIIPDNDESGRASAEAIAQALYGHAASVREVHLAGLSAKGDASDWLDHGHNADHLRAKFEATQEWSPEDQPAAGPSPEGRRLKVHRLSDIEEREIAWLWTGWLARQEFSIHAAHPGLGKTTFSLALAAAFSTGGLLPDGTRAPIVNSLLMLAEDSLETTIAKGLRLHGADTSRIYCSQVVLDEQGAERSINLDKHLPEIERIVTAHDIGLVVLDPLTGFSQGKDRNSESDVRDTLTPLRQLAERHQFAVLGVAHFGKANGSQRTLLQSVLGSTGYVALARTVLASAELGEDQQPDDADLDTGLVRITEVIKSNLDIRPPAITWRRPKDGAIRWLGETELDVETVLTATRDRGTGTLEQAKAFIEEQLHGGSKPATTMETAAKARGIAKVTLKRAKKELRVESIKLPNQDGAWIWRLPTDASESGAAVEGDQQPVEGDQCLEAHQMIPFDAGEPPADDDQVWTEVGDDRAGDPLSDVDVLSGGVMPEEPAWFGRLPEPVMPDDLGDGNDQDEDEPAPFHPTLACQSRDLCERSGCCILPGRCREDARRVRGKAA